MDLVAPAPSVSKSVVSFLTAYGAINVENRRDMIKFEMEVRHAEPLFQTTMFYFRHSNGIIPSIPSIPSILSSSLIFSALLLLLVLLVRRIQREFKFYRLLATTPPLAPFCYAFPSLFPFINDSSGKNIVIRTQDGYTIPSEIAQHVSLVSGLEEFPEVRNGRKDERGREGRARGGEAIDETCFTYIFYFFLK